MCQSFLGAKIHDPKDPGADLAAMLVQVVSAVFDLMGTYRDRWAAVESASGVPLFGFPHGVGLEPVSVNVGRMVGIFAQGVRDLGEGRRDCRLSRTDAAGETHENHGGSS